MVSFDRIWPAGWPLVSALALALAVPAWAAAVDPGWPVLALHCVLGWTLLRLAWIDWRTFRLPDRLTLPLLLLGLAASLATSPAGDPWSHMIGAAAGYAAFRLVGLGYRRWRGIEGLGQGDAKLLAAGGAWLGWAALPWTVVLAAGLGLASAALAGWRRGGLDPGRMIPFGPAIALAIWIVRLHGFPGS